MTCKECILAKYCTGIGQCAENQRKLKENLVIHPNERLDEIAGIKQTQLFRLNRNLIKRGVAPRKLRRLLEEAYATTAHPETLLDEYLWKYAR